MFWNVLKVTHNGLSLAVSGGFGTKGVLLNWAKSSDWEGRTAKQIIEEEIF